MLLYGWVVAEWMDCSFFMVVGEYFGSYSLLYPNIISFRNMSLLDDTKAWAYSKSNLRNPSLKYGTVTKDFCTQA